MIDDVIIASVVPVVTEHLVRFSQNNLACTPMIVGDPAVKLGVSVDIDMPTQVGADRLVNAHAAANMAELPAIILDFGTATTFDLIKKGNVYAGGVIAPGIALSVQALSQNFFAKIARNRGSLLLERTCLSLGVILKRQCGQGFFGGMLR